MSGEVIFLIWVLVTAAFVLGWAARHWLHRAERGEDNSQPPGTARSEREEGAPDLSVVGHRADVDEIDLRDDADAKEVDERSHKPPP